MQSVRAGWSHRLRNPLHTHTFQSWMRGTVFKTSDATWHSHTWHNPPCAVIGQLCGEMRKESQFDPLSRSLFFILAATVPAPLTPPTPTVATNHICESIPSWGLTKDGQRGDLKDTNQINFISLSEKVCVFHSAEESLHDLIRPVQSNTFDLLCAFVASVSSSLIYLHCISLCCCSGPLCPITLSNNQM